MHVDAQNNIASYLLKYAYQELKHPALLPKLFFIFP